MATYRHIIDHGGNRTPIFQPIAHHGRVRYVVWFSASLQTRNIQDMEGSRMVYSKRGVKLSKKPQIGVLAPWSLHYLDQYNRYVRLSVRLLRDQADPSHDADVTQLLLITGSLEERPACTAFPYSTCQQTVLFLAVCYQMTHRCRRHWIPVHVCDYKRVKK